jgi:hypothetical protein
MNQIKNEHRKNVREEVVEKIFWYLISGISPEEAGLDKIKPEPSQIEWDLANIRITEEDL